jgi:uncharacterized protein (AIM24 family)
VAFVCLDGEIVEYTLDAGQVLKVDTGHVAMYVPTVEFDIEMVKVFKNILLGGEGLFLTTLRGPGRVWLQTMPTANLAKAMYEPTVEFDIEMVKGFKNILLGGEGLFLTMLRGPGRVWLLPSPPISPARLCRSRLPKGKR